MRYFAAYPDGTTCHFDVEPQNDYANPWRADIEAKLREYNLTVSTPAYFVDLSDPTRPRWAVSTRNAEALVTPSDVPPRVRANGERWLCQWAGEDCANGWHEHAPTDRDPRLDYPAWRAQQELPGEGDLMFLETLLFAFAGRQPTQDDLTAFTHALTERLWLLTPAAEDCRFG